MTDPLGRLADMERRLGAMERDLSDLRAATVGAAPVSGTAVVSPSRGSGLPVWAPPVPLAAPRAEGRVPSPSIASAPSLVVTSETMLKWGGVALVVLGVVFSVSTAIHRGWIGPELQLAGSCAIGLALIGLGFRLRSTRPVGLSHLSRAAFWPCSPPRRPICSSTC